MRKRFFPRVKKQRFLNKALAVGQLRAVLDLKPNQGKLLYYRDGKKVRYKKLVCIEDDDVIPKRWLR